MRGRDWFCASVLISGFLGFLVLMLVRDWKPSPPFFGDYGECLKGHHDSYITYQTMGVYPNTVSIPVVQESYVCDVREYPNGDGPDYQQRYREYEARLAEWYKRHPEKA